MEPRGNQGETVWERELDALRRRVVSLEARLAEERRRAEALRNLGTALGACERAPQLVDAVLAHLEPFDARSAVLYRLDGGALLPILRHGERPEEMRAGSPPPDVLQAIAAGQNLWREAPKVDGTPPGRTAGEAPAAASLALRLDGRVLGALILGYESPHVFSPEERTFHEAVAQLCAQALEDVTTRQQLEEEGRRLRAVLDTAPVGIFLADATGRITLANEMAARIWGGPAPLARDISEYGDYRAWWPDSRRPLIASEWGLARALEGETTLGEVLDIRRFDGSSGTILNTSAPVRDRTGTTVGAVSVMLDVTEQRRVQHERLQLLEDNRTQRELLEAILAIDPGGVALLRVRDARYLLVNPAYRSWIPDPRTDPVGRTVEEIWPAGEAAAQRERLARSVRGEVAGREFLTRAMPDGTVRHFNVQVRKLQWEGEPAVLETLWDITPLEEAERRALAAAADAQSRAAELHTLIETAGDGFVLYSADGRLVRTNEAAEALLGYDADERALPIEQRMRVMEFASLDGKPLPAERTPMRRVLQGEVIRGEVVFQRHKPSGRERWLNVSASPIRGATGELIGAVCTLTDVTALQRLREQREDLVRTISHDLRTPLSTVLMQAEMLRRQPDDPSTVLRRVGGIITSARRMNAMIQDLVDLARLESGQLRLALEPVALSALVQDLSQRLAGTLDVSRLRFEIPADLPKVRADVDRLERILINLLSNALKYSPAESEVVLRAAACERGVCIEVEDRGLGIAPEDQPRLFERYFRTRRTSRTEGLGLGLYITRMLVLAQGGHIAVRSEVGAGSVFRVTLEAAVEERAPRSAAGPSRCVEGASLSVLVADEDPALRAALREALQTAGYCVWEAEDGRQALEAVDRNRPSLVIVDPGLPDRGGGLFLQRLVSRPDAPAPLVLVVGVDASSAELPAAVAGRFDKPVALETLLEAIARLVGTPSGLSASPA